MFTSTAPEGMLLSNKWFKNCIKFVVLVLMTSNEVKFHLCLNFTHLIGLTVYLVYIFASAISLFLFKNKKKYFCLQQVFGPVRVCDDMSLCTCNYSVANLIKHLIILIYKILKTCWLENWIFHDSIVVIDDHRIFTRLPPELIYFRSWPNPREFFFENNFSA